MGWRYWRADEGWLCSLNKFKTWPAGRPLRAQCTLAMDHGPLPGEQCGCGIYAAIDLPTLKELVQPDLESPLVVGEVSLWGKVIPAELGFRAELAYPRRLWVVNDSVTSLDGPEAPLKAPGEREADAPLALTDRYGIPVESCDATWAVSEEAVNPWHLEPRVGEIRAAVAAFKQEVDRCFGPNWPGCGALSAPRRSPGAPSRAASGTTTKAHGLIQRLEGRLGPNARKVLDGGGLGTTAV